MKLFSNTINSLETAISQSTAKQKVISNNIANVDTPNYKAQEVRFNTALSNEMQKLQATKTNAKHFEFGGSDTSSFKIVSRNNTNYHHNGNNVDIDSEMTEMAKNQIQYNALIERISGKFNSLKTVIKGGR
ncbi:MULTISPECIES: flagellar basal body rod protein FlgB [Bacillaceae]|uniref:Flagellar basal body rod protein FlgB n=1 Tax=Metabacillus endolithicus TaxID=1535204 RepID=A0ABW5BVJ5_9BACI|nr:MULTISPECIES: flagellar basal body rod protein FlgB [Bacillaceae]PGT86660.1 flagellar basal body rod protein FlgB [Bacillus sp. AFS040349]UGB32666.1 flagellar basal body rod protein FlgB [Metabacillus sp. B2-18]UPG63249.1 flagellar basal body rod protein FlgB [Metabacillus endolithicus]